MAKKQTDQELLAMFDELLLRYQRSCLPHASTIKNPERVFTDFEGGPEVFVLLPGLAWTCCTRDLNLGGYLLSKYGEDVYMYALDGLRGLGLLTKNEEERLLKLFHDEVEGHRERKNIQEAWNLLRRAGYRVTPPIKKKD